MAFPTSSSSQAVEVWRVIRSNLDMDTPAPVTDMLGCQIIRDRVNRKLILSQSKAIEALRDKIGFNRSSKVITPMDSKFIPTKKDCPSTLDPDILTKQTEFRSQLMSLVYFARWTIPQILAQSPS